MCRANCKSCQDSYNCDVCEDNYFRLDGVFSKCVHTCPVGYLPDNTQSLGTVCETGTLPFKILFPATSRNLLGPYKHHRTLRLSSHNLLAVHRFNVWWSLGWSLLYICRSDHMFQLLSLNLRLGYSKRLLVRTSSLLIYLSLGLF